MPSFTIVATGAMFPRPEERTAATAIEAEAHHLSLSRLCGRAGKVQIFADQGRELKWDRLQRLALAERGLAPTQPVSPSAAPGD